MPIFALFFGITCSLPGMGNQKGIRCKTGAVPAAVCLRKKLFELQTTVCFNGWEGDQKEGEPEYLPRFIYYFLLSGRIAKMNCNSIVIHFLY